jgi:aerotaxis receptor
MQSNLRLDQAYQAHLQTKAELIAKAVGCDIKDVAKFMADDSCALGKWLYGEGRQKYGSMREYELLLAAHQTFYCVIAIIADVAAQRESANFHEALIESAHLKAASTEVGLAIRNLRSVLNE